MKYLSVRLYFFFYLYLFYPGLHIFFSSIVPFYRQGKIRPTARIKLKKTISLEEAKFSHRWGLFAKNYWAFFNFGRLVAILYGAMSEYEAQMNALKELWVNLILDLDLDLFFSFNLQTVRIMAASRLDLKLELKDELRYNLNNLNSTTFKSMPCQWTVLDLESRSRSLRMDETRSQGKKFKWIL